VLELVARDPAPEHWQVLASQAQALAHLGRKTEAVTAIQRAIVAGPNNPEVAYGASLVYAVVGDTTSALASVERALSLSYNRLWFTLPWFEPLRGQPRFQTLLQPLEKPPPAR
jgi:tetratricopeptide (TPR) repeat protein